MARTREHIIETESRRIVPSLLPAERFVERDQTERDYGIDLVVECFDDNEPSGAYLMFQLKGTDDPSPASGDKSIAFDIKVADLKRVERFTTPILLIRCPVQATPQRFYFLWMQRYIKTVLNYENEGWRDQKYIRLHIPTDNVILASVPNENNLRKLRHIANHPQRLEQFGQLARLTHEAPFLWDDPAKLAPLFEEVLRLDAIFGDSNWQWANYQRGVVEKGLLACQIALRGIDPTDDELRSIGWVLADEDSPVTVSGGPPHPSELTWQKRWEFLGYAAQHCAQLLLNMVAVYFDDRLANTLWQHEGNHDF